jgi:uncharacterized protein (DUF1330 family)
VENVNKPAYLVVQLELKNQEEYLQRYGLPVLAIFEDRGAEVVAVSPAPVVLDGEWSGNWTVVVRFPSMQVAQDWYQSPEYQSLKELRINELTESGAAVLVDGFDPVALGVDIPGQDTRLDSGI